MVQAKLKVNTPFLPKMTKVRARTWRYIWFFFYRPTPWFLYRYRVWLLNLFGADVHKTAHPECSAFVEFPWNLKMEENSSIGERSWIYCVDKIVIGSNSCIGQGCHLITGSHNYRSPEFELITSPIIIGNGCWLTNNVTVLMGVTLGNHCVIGAKSLVSNSLPENVIAFGQPARAHSKRFS